MPFVHQQPTVEVSQWGTSAIATAVARIVTLTDRLLVAALQRMVKQRLMSNPIGGVEESPSLCTFKWRISLTDLIIVC